MSHIGLKTATDWAEALATQAGNYARAVRNGTPHDPGEADSLVSTAERLRALAAQEFAEKNSRK